MTIVAFLIPKRNRDRDYRLIKDLWAFEGRRIAVREDGWVSRALRFTA